jgi:hypothetical protein
MTKGLAPLLLTPKTISYEKLALPLYGADPKPFRPVLLH